MKLLLRAVASTVLLWLAAHSAPALAFHLDDTGHGGITKSALSQVSITIAGETLKFSERAKEEIKTANFDVDKNQIASSYHFDDENLLGGSTRINTLKEQVISSAVGGDGKGARKALGGAFHTIQDFFAHSSQVDLGLGIPNFGVDVLNATSAATCITTPLDEGRTLIPGAGLTTGYFLPFICLGRFGKCKHGLAGLCAGIAKDEPSNTLHGTANSNAVTASKNFVMLILNDARMSADPKAIKRLLDVRPTIGAVIDDTGSMGGVITGVSSAVAGIVNSLRGTADEPDKYLLVRFGDPSVGSPSSFSEAAGFLSAVNAIVPSGGGDCPEFSMSGAYKAVVAAENDSRLFIFTDASAKDAAQMGSVANLATQKRIQLTTALSGNCSPYDPTYFELARRTGGQVFITTRNESGATLANLMQPLIRNDVHLIVQASLDLLGGTAVLNAPVDDSVSQVVFSVGMITKGVIAIRRPSGAIVQIGDPGVVVTETIGSRTVTVNSPQVGDWKVEIAGSGVTLVTVNGVTPAYLYKFEFANMAGRTGHQGLFAIEGRPIAGKTQTVRAVIHGDLNVSEFSFRRPDGVVISRFPMSRNSPLGATADEYVGEVIPPSGPFLVYVSGITAGGRAFQRAVPGQQITSSVEVRSASDLTSVPAGRATAVAFSVTNHGAAASFALSSVDSRGFLSAAAASPVFLGMNETRTVTVNVTPPAGTPAATEFAMTLTATGGADATSNSASVFLTVDSNNRDPVCSAAAASPAILRQMNHKLVPISIVGITDPDGNPVQIRISTISQDEPLSGLGSGRSIFDATGVGTAVAQVRAERSGRGDGRVYRIAFDATDGQGGQCSGSVKVEVPHDNRTSAPDGGSGVNSANPR